MPPRKTEPTDETPVAELWNLSDLTASWLNEVGIHTYGDLRQADLFALWAELRGRHRQVSKLMYYAMWGAVGNCHWNRIPPEEIARFDAWRAGQSGHPKTSSR
ncbi:MAG: TfoX/Sxy family protein [Fimbriimonadaceae bacterium]|nr:TfoX/Sxy family protein [Fimbriimonadaceae bacterium]